MPSINRFWWADRQLLADNPCHYLSRPDDWYASIVRKRGIERAWPDQSNKPRQWRVLDVGCGDGRLSGWMKRTFGVFVTGTDAYQYAGVLPQVDSFFVADASELGDLMYPYDLVTVVTVLCHLDDWRDVVGGLGHITDRVLLVGNYQTPTPPWQRNQSHKVHLEIDEVVEAFSEHGFKVVKHVPINVLDRQLLVRVPQFLKWPVAAMTVCVDLLLTAIPSESVTRKARYVALLFERSEHG